MWWDCTKVQKPVCTVTSKDALNKAHLSSLIECNYIAHSHLPPIGEERSKKACRNSFIVSSTSWCGLCEFGLWSHAGCCDGSTTTRAELPVLWWPWCCPAPCLEFRSTWVSAVFFIHNNITCGIRIDLYSGRTVLMPEATCTSRPKIKPARFDSYLGVSCRTNPACTRGNDYSDGWICHRVHYCVGYSLFHGCTVLPRARHTRWHQAAWCSRQAVHLDTSNSIYS